MPAAVSLFALEAGGGQVSQRCLDWLAGNGHKRLLPNLHVENGRQPEEESD
jgi:hypothetical protein